MYSTVASIAGSVMLLRSIADLLPEELKDYILYYIYLFNCYIINLFVPPQLTMVISEFNGLVSNEIYEAAEIYLGGKINPTTKRLRISKPKKETNFNVAMEKDEQVLDFFDGAKFKWRFVCKEVKNTIMQSPYYNSRPASQQAEVRYFQLSFEKKHEDKVLGSYLPYVLTKAKSMKEAKKSIKIFTVDRCGMYTTLGEAWKSVKLDHPSTFDTLAMDPELKKTIMDDLAGFVKRKEFYKRVGKAWKRGYLLYGPPGTGKSSLIAAMANYLKFDIYDLDLTDLQYNSELRKLMVASANKSILVIEDIDCSIDLEDREKESKKKKKRKDDKDQVTLSGVLNFIDGLWSTCEDERIIIFTTNHKDKLDPALLRPGRMDMHINLSYCTPAGFKLLASRYLEMEHHPLFQNIEILIKKVEVTPAEVAEKLMKYDKPDVVIKGLLDFLEKKKIEQDEAKGIEGDKPTEGKEGQNEEEKGENEVVDGAKKDVESKQGLKVNQEFQDEERKLDEDDADGVNKDVEGRNQNLKQDDAEEGKQGCEGKEEDNVKLGQDEEKKGYSNVVRGKKEVMEEQQGRPSFTIWNWNSMFWYGLSPLLNLLFILFWFWVRGS